MIYRALLMAQDYIPEPLVYYDVRKQNTKNTDTVNRGKLLDLSGNENHGVLNNFDYTAAINKVYFDDEFPLTLVNPSISKEGHVYTLGSDISTIGAHLLNYEYANIPISITTEEYSIRVTGIQEGQQIEVIPWGIINSAGNKFSANRVVITHDGVYNIPSQTTEVPQVATVTQVIQGLIWCNATPVSAGLTIEYLPTVTSDSGQYYIDDIYPLGSNADATVEGHKVTVNKDFSGETNGRFIAGSNVDLTDNILQVPAMKLKVSGLVSGEVQIGYINGSFKSKLTITSDGTYYIPGYEVPKAGENVNRRVWSIYSYYDSNNVGVNSGVVIEILPVQRDGWVETYIDDEFPILKIGSISYENHLVSATTPISSGSTFFRTSSLLSGGGKERAETGFQMKSYTIKVSGLGESSFRLGYYYSKYFPIVTIDSDGIYEIPSWINSKYEPDYSLIPIYAVANSEIPIGCTIEFLPRTDYIQFDGNDDNITIPTVTEGFKTVFIVSETQQNDNERGVIRLYEQKKASDDRTFSLISYDTHIAYNSLSTGETFINGTLNTTIDGGVLKDHRICVAHRNNDVNADNSKSPIIGVVSQDGNNGPFRISKFLGFSEYLSDTQIKKVIDKYGLMEGVSPI